MFAHHLTSLFVAQQVEPPAVKHRQQHSAQQVSLVIRTNGLRASELVIISALLETRLVPERDHNQFLRQPKRAIGCERASVQTSAYLASSTDTCGLSMELIIIELVLAAVVVAGSRWQSHGHSERTRCTGRQIQIIQMHIEMRARTLMQLIGGGALR